MKPFTWESPTLEIVSVDIRTIQKTQRKYAVLRGLIVAMNYANRKEGRTFRGKETTLMCFKETLLPVFKIDTVYVFEGEISFKWGNTYLSITKVYLESGERLLREGSPERDCNHDGPCEECMWEGRCIVENEKPQEKPADNEVKEVRTVGTAEKEPFDVEGIPW